jgi:hypothetical protein
MTSTTESYRRDVFRQFFERWGGTYHPLNPNSVEDMTSAERQLGTLFPRCLMDFLSVYGDLTVSIDLLDVAVERELNLRVPAEFLNCAKIVRTTEGWVQAGMPRDLIAFATSATGDMFCVRRLDPGTDSRLDDMPIWYFDHEFVEVEQVASSLTAWLKGFIDIDVR